MAKKHTKISQNWGFWTLMWNVFDQSSSNLALTLMGLRARPDLYFRKIGLFLARLWPRNVWQTCKNEGQNWLFFMKIVAATKSFRFAQVHIYLKYVWRYNQKHFMFKVSTYTMKFISKFYSSGLLLCIFFIPIRQYYNKGKFTSKDMNEGMWSFTFCPLNETSTWHIFWMMVL